LSAGRAQQARINTGVSITGAGRTRQDGDTVEEATKGRTEAAVTVGL
jgi:hypothetical protein